MNKKIAAAAFTAAMLMAAPHAFAADSADGAPGNQPAGQATSDRTPEKKTTTPPTQVDQTKQGETSDRTPGHHKN